MSDPLPNKAATAESKRIAGQAAERHVADSVGGGSATPREGEKGDGICQAGLASQESEAALRRIEEPNDVRRAPDVPCTRLKPLIVSISRATVSMLARTSRSSSSLRAEPAFVINGSHRTALLATVRV